MDGGCPDVLLVIWISAPQRRKQKKIWRRAESLEWNTADAVPKQDLIVCRISAPDKFYPSLDFSPALLG